MTTILVEATVDDKSIIVRLLQLYMYDFSEYTLDDVNAHAEYVYNRLDYYWTENDRYAFLIKTDGKISGFALVRTENKDGSKINSITEYFILRKYRKHGIGKNVAQELFRKFPGNWKVAVLNCNTLGLIFWENVINEITDSNYEKIDKKEWPGPMFEFKI